MSFTNNKAIFEQIADRLADEIMAENYPPGGRIPSVREYAALLQVNTNTAIKGYELLAREGIIFNKRGMGYFVAEDARHHIAQRRQEEFMETTLPELFRQMRLLNIGIDEVAQKWEESKEGIIPASSPLLSGGEETQQEILKTTKNDSSWEETTPKAKYRGQSSTICHGEGWLPASPWPPFQPRQLSPTR